MLSRSPSSAEDGSIEALLLRLLPDRLPQSPSSAEDGSIEASDLISGPMMLDSLRPQLRTAPLKLRKAHMRKPDYSGSPSSAEDGSIEALHPSRRPSFAASTSPSSAEDGSIEATVPSQSRNSLLRSPSSAEDGSIEAGHHEHSCRASATGLRPLLRTAPLKLSP